MRFLHGPLRLLLAAAVVVGLALAAMPSTVALDARRSAGAGPQLAPSLARARLVCPGPELSGLKGAQDRRVSPTIAVVEAPADLTGVSPGEPGDDELRIGPLASRPDDAVADAKPGMSLARDLKDPVPVAVTGTGQLAPGLAAAQEWVADGKDLRGLVTVPCARPATDLWLLGGTGGAGAEERLVLVNAGQNVVTAQIDLIGPKGAIDTPGGGEVSVPAQGRAVVLLDALAPGLTATAVHVRASGGAVTASLASAVLNGSTPTGADTTGPVAAPAEVAVIPAAYLGPKGFVRIAVPGTEQAVVRLTLLTAKGEVTPAGGGVARVPGGGVADVPVSTGAAATAVRVSADVPVLAAAYGGPGPFTGKADFAWGPALEPVTTLAGLPVGATIGSTELDRQLLLASPDPATLRVTAVTGGKAETTTVSLTGGQLVTKGLGAVDVVWVQADRGHPRAAVVTSAGTGDAALVSVAPLVSPPARAELPAPAPLPRN